MKNVNGNKKDTDNIGGLNLRYHRYPFLLPDIQMHRSIQILCLKIIFLAVFIYLGTFVTTDCCRAVNDPIPYVFRIMADRHVFQTVTAMKYSLAYVFDGYWKLYFGQVFAFEKSTFSNVLYGIRQI